MASSLRAGVPITHRDQLPSSSRYELLVKIASGGMATVYVGRLNSVAGTTRLVAIKRAHAHLMEDPAFAKMLIAEAKLASRIHHPNVVAVQNVEEVEGELLLVMDYVEGASLAELSAFEDMPLPAKVAVRMLLDGCAGLQAAHELTDDDGEPLGIVHRDVSPHNILVGVDGVARLTDFGIAKSSGHTASAGQTTTGALKGKVAYMAPEYVESGKLDARSDVFSLGIVAWETLTRRRLFRGATEIESLKLVLATEVPRPSEVAPWLGSALDAVISKALARAPANRFASAAELGEALEVAARREDLIATASNVAAFVRTSTGDMLARRRALIRVPQETFEVTTANARYDAATRAVIDAHLGGTGEVAGRAEETSPLGGAGGRLEDASEVRARESVTSPIAAASGPAVEASSSTSPLVNAPSARQEIATEKTGPSDGSTLGGGVSAQTVDDARAEARGRRSKRRVVAVVIAAVSAAVAAAVALPVVRKAGQASAKDEPTARAEVPAVSPPALPVASAMASVSVVQPPPGSATASAIAPPASATASSAPAPSTSTVARAVVPPAPKPPAAKSHLALPPRPPSALKPPPPPDATPTGDRAPPNPYAH